MPAQPRTEGHTPRRTWRPRRSHVHNSCRSARSHTRSVRDARQGGMARVTTRRVEPGGGGSRRCARCRAAPARRVARAAVGQPELGGSRIVVTALVPAGRTVVRSMMTRVGSRSPVGADREATEDAVGSPAPEQLAHDRCTCAVGSCDGGEKHVCGLGSVWCPQGAGADRRRRTEPPQAGSPGPTPASAPQPCSASACQSSASPSPSAGPTRRRSEPESAADGCGQATRQARPHLLHHRRRPSGRRPSEPTPLEQLARRPPVPSLRT